MLECGLAKLSGELCCGIVQEVAVLAKHVAIWGAALLCLVWVAIVLGLWLGLRGRRW